MAGSDHPAGRAGPAGTAPLRSGRRPERAASEKGGPEAAPDRSGADREDLQHTAGNSAYTSVLAPTPGDLVRSVIGRAGRPMDQEAVRMVHETTGADASGIEVHEGPDAAEAAASVDAEMFASGGHLVAPKGLDVTTREGAFKTIHEVHHIVNQQAKGAVEGTDTADGLRISDPGDRHEREADQVAADAVRRRFGR